MSAVWEVVLCYLKHQVALTPPFQTPTTPQTDRNPGRYTAARSRQNYGNRCDNPQITTPLSTAPHQSAALRSAPMAARQHAPLHVHARAATGTKRAAIVCRQEISFGGEHHTMAGHRRRIGQHRPHIIFAEIRKVRNDLVHASPTGQHLQYIAHPHPSACDDRPPPANGGIDGDTGKACKRHAIETIREASKLLVSRHVRRRLHRRRFRPAAPSYGSGRPRRL